MNHCAEYGTHEHMYCNAHQKHRWKHFLYIIYHFYYTRVTKLLFKMLKSSLKNQHHYHTTHLYFTLLFLDVLKIIYQLPFFQKKFFFTDSTSMYLIFETNHH